MNELEEEILRRKLKESISKILEEETLIFQHNLNTRIEIATNNIICEAIATTQQRCLARSI